MLQCTQPGSTGQCLLGLWTWEYRSYRGNWGYGRECFSAHSLYSLYSCIHNPNLYSQAVCTEAFTSSPHYPQSNGLAESMVKVSKNLIEKAVRQDLPWSRLLLDYRCTPISSEIPSPAEILFGRKLRSSISILPSQVMNDRISKQRELIAKKEGKFYTNVKDL